MRKETDSLRKQAEISGTEAVTILNKAIAIHTDRAPLYLQRGLAYWRNGDVEAMEVDMSTALALDATPSTAVAHFFRALGRVKCGHITGALSDLGSCVDKMGWNSKAGGCARQESHYVEALLARQRKYCDAAAVAAAAKACAAREARGAALAEEARAQGSLVRRQWIRMAREQRAATAHHANTPEEITDIPTVPRINTQAKCCEDSSPTQSPRSVASWPASSAPSSPPDSPRQAEVAPAQPSTTPAEARALAALQQAVEGMETDVPPQSAASSPADSPRHADVAPDQPSASSAPEQPAEAPAEHESAAEAEAPPSPVCLCMHEDGATTVLDPLERYRCAVSLHACCSCGRYCKPSDGQQHDPDILAALATMKKEAEVYLRQLKTSQPHTGTDGLQPSSHEQSALSLATAGASQDGCGATSAPQPRPKTAADSSCAPAEAACKKKDKKKSKKRKGHCRRG
ncbi:hypothetical protein COCOBI_17-1660 [Coccomyxa sp. Obi]|nr:hypothetical protein COCOBI_17-1660 [Coccomyxa sp. Obi]